MGKPTYLKNMCLYAVGYIVWEPCEVKHLSSTRKIKKFQRKLKIDSLSSGERKGKHIVLYSLIGFHPGW